MKRSRNFSLLAVGTLLGSLAIAQGMAQDAPQDAAQDAPPADATADEETAAPAPPFLDLRRITPVKGDLEAGRGKSELCSACHGANGVSVATVFPNLAGQRPDYLYWELVEYHSGARPESPMTPPAASLNEADMRDLAVFYASLPPGLTPSPEGESAPADQATIERGQQIYMEGDPAKGIPPCQGCHGADGGGHPLATTPDRNGYTPWAAYPSLRGQNGDYLQARLTSFRDAEPRNSSTDHVMSGVGARLDDDSIAALSAWLASQAH